MSERLKRVLPSLLFTAGLGVACLLYLWDAASLSLSPLNLLLLLPLTLLGVLLCALVIAQDVRAALRDGSARAKKKPPLDWRVPTLMVLVGLFVTATMTIGYFDLVTLCFVAVTLVLLGERRPWVVVIFSAVFTLVVVLGLKQALTFDVSTLLL